MENVFAYELDDALYLNITNQCTNRCVFCIRRNSAGIGGYNLWLEHEPDLDELLAAAGDVRQYREVVFCGYGEPLTRIALVLAASREFKKQGAHIRVNTNGQANLIHGRNIVPALAGLVDAVSISLNAPDARQYVSICQPQKGEAAYLAMLEFAAQCKIHIPQVVLSVVRWPGVDIEKCRAIAKNLQTDFKVRSFSGTLT